MAETGDWVTPRLYGTPWFEKPVLYYWAAALGFRLHLPAEWAARLPSAFAALAAAIAIGWLGWKHYGSGEDWSRAPCLLAPAMFCTSVAAIGFARAATPDMLFAASITLAMACAASVLRRSGDLRGHDESDPAPCARAAARSRDPSVLRRVSWSGRSRERSGRGDSGWRRDRNLGVGDRKMARGFAARPSDWHRGIRISRAAVVRDLRATESGFSARIYFSAQLRALPDAGISAQTTVLVFRADHAPGAASLDHVLVRKRAGRCSPGASEILGRFSRIFFRMLGHFPDRFLQLFAVQIAQLHSCRRFRRWR